MKTAVSTIILFPMLLLGQSVNLWAQSVVPEFTISTVAGDGSAGYSGDGGIATSAALSSPFGVAADSAGNVYIADFNNVRIRKVSPTGTITTFAGTGVAGFSGDGGQATSAMLNRPSKVSVDGAGNVYIVDSGNSRIRKVTPNGIINSIAGNGNAGESGDGGLATSASLNYPEDVTADAAGNLYIADGDGSTVRKVAVGGIISTVAGNGGQGYSGDGGAATAASLNNPSSVAVDTAGDLFIGDTGNNRVREVVNGIITTVAGTGTPGFAGDGGPATAARLAGPTAKLDAAGNLYIEDSGNNRVRIVLTNGTIWTVAGNGNARFAGDGGPAADASLHFPTIAAVAASGGVYVADAFNERIRLLTPMSGVQNRLTQFTISTAVGDGTAGFSGDGGPALDAEVHAPYDVELDAAGNLYIADFGNNRIREVAVDGTITTIAGTGQAGYSGDGGPAINATLFKPSGLRFDVSGNLYIADQFNNVVRKIAPGGIITTFAGSVQGYCGDGELATSACLNGPLDMAVDSTGNVYIADFGNSAVRKVDLNGIITTVAGGNGAGYGGDGAPATAAILNHPESVTFDTSGDLFIADAGNNRIRKVTNGIISTVAGTGSAGYSGDGGPAVGAQFNLNGNMRFDASGNLYVTDARNNRIRVILPDGTIWTAAGNGKLGYNGDGGPATGAEIGTGGIAINSSGGIYLASVAFSRIRLLSPGAQPPALNAGGAVSASAFGEFAAVSPGSWIEIYGTNLAVDTRGWGAADFKGPNAPTSLDGTSVTIAGQSAFVDYISPGQVNALIPSTVPTGTQQLTVTTPGGSTSAINLTVNPVEPGLLAPPNFNIGGTPFVVALFADDNYALPMGAISGLPSRPAKPGDEIVLFGVGFGPVMPNIPAGVLVGVANTLADNFQISIGGIQCQVVYDGLAPDFTGLYQFNIVVPDIASGNQPLTFALDGVPNAQTLYVAVQN